MLSSFFLREMDFYRRDAEQRRCVSLAVSCSSAGVQHREFGAASLQPRRTQGLRVHSLRLNPLLPLSRHEHRGARDNGDGNQELRVCCLSLYVLQCSEVPLSPRKGGGREDAQGTGPERNGVRNGSVVEG